MLPGHGGIVPPVLSRAGVAVGGVIPGAGRIGLVQDDVIAGRVLNGVLSASGLMAHVVKATRGSENERSSRHAGRGCEPGPAPRRTA